MAATDFVNSKYESDNGTIVRIRIDTLTLTNNAPPAADIDLPIFAKVSGGRRQFGLKPRGVRLIDPGATSTEKDKFTFVPILTKTTFDALVAGAAYPGKPGYSIAAKVAESPVS